jgi:hypothetical protein
MMENTSLCKKSTLIGPITPVLCFGEYHRYQAPSLLRVNDVKWRVSGRTVQACKVTWQIHVVSAQAT